MKVIMNIVGARPQFIKASIVSRELMKLDVDQICQKLAVVKIAATVDKRDFPSRLVLVHLLLALTKFIRFRRDSKAVDIDIHNRLHSSILHKRG